MPLLLAAIFYRADENGNLFLTSSLFTATTQLSLIINDLLLNMDGVGWRKPQNEYLCIMYVRRKKNRSGSISVVVVSKSSGHYKEIKSFGTLRSA